MNNNIFQKIGVSQKSNPDVASKFNSTLNNRDSSNFNLGNSLWKGITGDSIPTDVKTVDDLKIQIDKPDNDYILSKLNEAILQREHETSLINEQKKMKEKTMPIMSPVVDSSKSDQCNILDHHDLKSYHIHENDRLQKEKERFNALLKDLDGIF